MLSYRRLLPLACRTYWVVLVGSLVFSLLGALLMLAADSDAMEGCSKQLTLSKQW